RFEAIVRSMTPKERRHPEIINGSRRKRIASGAGVSVQQVNQAITNFEQMRQMMRGLASGNFPGMPAMGGGFRPMQQGIAKRKSKDNKKPGGGSSSGGNRFRMPFGRG